MTPSLTQSAPTQAARNTLPTMMRAAVLLGHERIEIREVATPQPTAGQVLVRLEGCGVCASNIPVWEGREWFTYPAEAGAPGHEGWGEIVAVGEEVSGLRPGERVALYSAHAYAQYDLAEASEVVRLPHELAGHPFPGEPLACAINIVKRCDFLPGQTVAIIGIGFMGALVCQMATHMGARVIAISRRTAALEMAHALGATHTLPLDDHWALVEAVKRLTDGELCPRVIEATGLQWPLDLASDLTGTRGRLVIAGYHQDGARQVNMQAWNWKGLDVINAHERDPQVYREGMEEAVQRVAAGTLNPTRLFTHTYPLEQLAEALAATRDRPGNFMKALIIHG